MNIIEKCNEIVDEAKLNEEEKKDHKIILPMIKRVFPTILAEELCKVQPMTMPSGLAVPMRTEKAHEDDLPEDKEPEFSKVFDSIFNEDK